MKAENIRYCGCKFNLDRNTSAAELQDKIYGNGMRVHTKTTTKGEWRCTVCGHQGTKNK